MNSKRQNIFLVVLLLFLLAQTIRPSKNEGDSSGTKDITTIISVPQNVYTALKTACFDCHSNHSNYPWYDEITPVNWWVAGHINKGKRELNFTEFGRYSLEEMVQKLEAVAESVDEGWMPLSTYTFAHPKAKLTKLEKASIVEWATTARKMLKD